MLQAITTKDDAVKTEAKLEFMEYGTKARGDKSGAYLFMPGMLLKFDFLLI